MPQLGTVVVKDYTPVTPVDRTFIPRDIVDGVATVEESTGVPIGNNSLSVSVKRTATGRYKGILRGRFPIVQTQTINGISTPTVVRTSNGEITFNFDATSTEQERVDALEIMCNAIKASNNTIIRQAFTKLQGIY